MLTPDPGHRLHLSPRNKARARVTMTHYKTGFLFDGLPKAELWLSWGYDNMKMTPVSGHRLHLGPSNKHSARVTMSHYKTGLLFDGVPNVELRLSWGFDNMKI